MRPTTRHTRRGYLRFAGLFLLGLALPARVGAAQSRSPVVVDGGTSLQQGDRTGIERGEVDFEWENGSFEARGGAVELEDGGFSIESRPLQSFELKIDVDVVRFDLDIDVGSGLDFQVSVDGVTLTAEADASGVEMSVPEGVGATAFEAEDGDVQIDIGPTTTKFSADARTFEIDGGPLSLEIRGDGRGTVTIDYDDGVHDLDLERSGPDRILEIDYEGSVEFEWSEATQEFEAERRVVRRGVRQRPGRAPRADPTATEPGSAST